MICSDIALVLHVNVDHRVSHPSSKTGARKHKDDIITCNNYDAIHMPKFTVASDARRKKKLKHDRFALFFCSRRRRNLQKLPLARAISFFIAVLHDVILIVYLKPPLTKQDERTEGFAYKELCSGIDRSAPYPKTAGHTSFCKKYRVINNRTGREERSTIC